MKLYKTGAVLMAMSLCVSCIPLTAVAEEKQADKSKSQTIKSAAKTEKKESSENKETDKKETKEKSTEKKTKEQEKTEKQQEDSLENVSPEQNQEEEKTDLENYIPITTMEELQKIGTEGYPLDGKYYLANDLNGKDAGTGESSTIEPLFQNAEGFTGEIEGNNHAIANYNIELQGEETTDTGFFKNYHGILKNIRLLNITVYSNEKSGAVLADSLEGAKLSNIFIAGTVTNRLDREPDKESKKMAVCLKEQETVFENVNVISDIDTLTGGEGAGITMLTTNPEYISCIEGEEEQIEAPEIQGFTFKGWSVKSTEEGDKQFEGKISRQTARNTVITGKEGRYEIKATYVYGLKPGIDANEEELAQDQTVEIEITAPYIVGKVINEVNKLEPVDEVFPNQINAVLYLEPIDGVFPGKMDVGTKTNGETIKITSWEQFKNIGNTDYNSHFTMDANYVLEASIYSDGKPFTPIGTKENPFKGSFNGNGFEINVSNNPEIDTNAEYNGLFGAVKN